MVIRGIAIKNYLDRLEEGAGEECDRAPKGGIGGGGTGR